MRRYDSYKDSGVEWIGEIPSHWTKIKLSYLMEDDGFRSGPFGSTLITSQLLDKGKVQVLSPEFIHRGMEEFPLFIPKERENELSKYLVKEGDIVIPIVGTIGRGKVIKKDDPIGILNQRLCRITPNKNKVNLSLLHLLLTESNLVKVQYRLEKRGSILDHITKEILFKFQLPIPPLSEQQQIVSFLDTKTSLIDSLIEKTQRKIELLKEKRTSLINEVVTKGLNPNVEMKDSGVEWIGEIPSHWETIKLKYQGGVIIGLSYTPDNVVDEGGESILVMRSSNVQNGKPSFNDNVFVDCDVPDKLKTRENDILICSRNGSRRLIGKNCLIPKEYEGLTWGVFMTVYRSESPKFFYWVLNSPVFESQSGLFLTSTINQLTVSTLENMVVPFVSDKIEQQQIVEYLDEQTQLIDKTISIEVRRIELLKEYRQSIISEVVTGKVKVVN
jgi:type I restriction enzyme S subunit